jgi:hypothetical protein
MEIDRNIFIETNVGEVIKISEPSDIRFAQDKSNKGIIPYIKVKYNIEAIFNRSSANELTNQCNFATVNSKKRFGFWSNKTFFPID